jgi:enoyl-CoA hydratase
MDDGKANEMDFVFFEEMGKILDCLEGDGAKTVVISGRPGFFSAGLDMKLLPTLSPNKLNDLVKIFAQTILRIFSLPIPTVAVCGGHTIAGGAMLAFSCDLRLVVDGPYRIQINEVMGGVPLLSWMLLIGRSVIPLQWQTEALLHARAYDPSEAVEKGIFHRLVRDEDIGEHTKTIFGNLMKLNLPAYDTTKRRMRNSEVKHVLELLKEELPGKTN